MVKVSIQLLREKREPAKIINNKTNNSINQTRRNKGSGNTLAGLIHPIGDCTTVSIQT